MERAKKDWQLNQLLIMKEEKERMQDENEDEIFYVCDDGLNKVRKKKPGRKGGRNKSRGICFDVSSDESDAKDEPIVIEPAPKRRRYTRRSAPPKPPAQEDDEVALETTMLDDEEDDAAVVDKKQQTRKNKRTPKPRKKKALKEPKKKATPKKVVGRSRKTSFDQVSSGHSEMQEEYSDIMDDILYQGQQQDLLGMAGFNSEEYYLDYAPASPEPEPSSYNSPHIITSFSRTGRPRKANRLYDDGIFVSDVPEEKLNERVRSSSKSTHKKEYSKRPIQVVVDFDPSTINVRPPVKNARNFSLPKVQPRRGLFDLDFEENGNGGYEVEIISDEVPSNKNTNNNFVGLTAAGATVNRMNKKQSTPVMQNKTSSFSKITKSQPASLKTITIPTRITTNAFSSSLKKPTVFPSVKKITSIKPKQPMNNLIKLPLTIKTTPKPFPSLKKQPSLTPISRNLFDDFELKTKDDDNYVHLKPVNLEESCLDTELEDEFLSSFHGLT